MAAHQAPLSLGFSRQEHWSGLPFPSPMHESEKSKWSRSVVSDSWRPHGLQPSRLLRPLDFPGKSTGVGCHCLVQPTSTSMCLKFPKVLNIAVSQSASFIQSSASGLNSSITWGGPVSGLFIACAMHFSILNSLLNFWIQWRVASFP